MQEQNNQLDFSKQNFFIGIDVHKKQWTVAIRCGGMELKRISIDPKPNKLLTFLEKHYPGGHYYTVYEAGFSGFWIDRELNSLGIKNIIVNPADIPTKHKERANRNDMVDASKLARELEKGNLSSLYIPTELQQELRSLCRLRYKLVKDTIRIKNRIKGFLLFYGKAIPENREILNWSGKFISYLESIEFETEIGQKTLSTMLDELKEKKRRTAEVIKLLKKYSDEYRFKKTIENLSSIPGIGFITAISLYTELIDINRFPTLDKLCCYVGITPSVDSSDQREFVRGMSQRHNKFLRNIIIEASWIAVRTDPALTEKWISLIGRMSKQKAIIRIAKKLLNRMRFVWKNQEKYEILKKQ